MTQTFRDVISWSQVGDGLYEGSVDDSWFQGRGAFGGVAAGAIIRAMDDVVDSDKHRIRALNTQFCAPLIAEPARLSVEIVRRGSSVIYADARIRQNGEVKTAATATFGRDRDSVVEFDATDAPDVASPENVDPAPDSPLFPKFSRYYEYRFCHGAIPYSASDDASVGGWCRLEDAEGPVDTAQAAALLDIWPPAVLTTVGEPMAAATISWQLLFETPLPLPGAKADDFHLVTSSTTRAGDGYAEQQSSLWTEDGHRLGRSQQLVAIFG